MPAEEMISLYFNKDLIEKPFQSLKRITNCVPSATGLQSAQVVLCYLAYLLLSLLLSSAGHRLPTGQSPGRAFHLVQGLPARYPKALPHLAYSAAH
jgi:hypothetical protein